MAGIRSRARARRRRIRAERAEDLVLARARSPTGCFGIFRTDPEAERHRGLTFILVPLDARRRHRPADRAARRRDRLRRGLLRRRARARAEPLGEEGQGWKVAMATAGFERGLILRSPARFQATARRLVELYRDATPRPRRCATRSRARGWTPRPTRSTPTGPRRASSPAARSAPRRASTRSSGPRWTCACTRRALALLGRRRRDGDERLARRLPVLARRPDLRRHQRDPAQRHRRARARPAAGADAVRFEFTEDQLLVPRRRARPARARSARRRTCAPCGRPTPAASPELWDKLAEMGVLGCSCPRRTAASASTRSTSSCSSRRRGAPRCPSRSSRRPRSACRCCATSARSTRLAARRRRDRRARRPSPYVADADVADLLLLQRGDELHALAARRGRARAAAVGSTAPGGSSPSTWTPAATRASRRRRGRAPSRGLRPRRARRRGPAPRRRPPPHRDGRRLRARARAVRPPDRLVPGGQAPARQRAGRPRVRAPGRLPRRLSVARDARRRATATCRWPRRTPPTPPRSRRGPRCRCTAPSATRGSTTCTSG